MSSGGGQQTSKQQSTSETGPPSFIQPYLQQGVQDLAQLYQSNPNAPAYYPGQTVADFSPQTSGSIGMASDLAANNPTLSAANG